MIEHVGEIEKCQGEVAYHPFPNDKFANNKFCLISIGRVLPHHAYSFFLYELGDLKVELPSQSGASGLKFSRLQSQKSSGEYSTKCH